MARSKKNTFSETVVETCRQAAQRASHYAHDLSQVLKAKKKKDVEEVIRSSMTDMGAVLDVASFDKHEKANGLRPSFDRLQLHMLEYPLSNISYHLGMDLRSQLEADVKLPKKVFFMYGKHAGEMSKMVSILLKNWELGGAQSLLQQSSVWDELVGYHHMVKARPNPAAAFATAVSWRFINCYSQLNEIGRSKESMNRHLLES